MRILKIAYHRNGIAGEPFYVVHFREGEHRLVAVVFDSPGTVAVLDPDLANRGLIEFGVNSWRGDVFEQRLREAIAEYEADPRRHVAPVRGNSPSPVEDSGP